jgi:hypothetical protein|tara:strand:+ start:493 stop:2256 length:1764 start_codon:yes stop_codon:yes gene_type:complete
MAQHDMNIANQGFPATRADINNALQAIATNNSGTSAPSTTFANQWWYDTTNNKLYIRNEANNAWIEVAVLDQTANEWQITTGTIQAKDSDGLALKTDDGTTRLFIKDSDGSVGIGTTSPSTALHVNSGTANNAVTLTSTDAYSLIKFEDNDTTTETTLGALDNDMVFRVGDAQRMVIASNGNVGIGNTSNTVDEILHIEQETSGDAATIKVQNGHASTGADAILQLQTVGNNFSIQTFPDADTSNANRTSFKSTAGSSFFTFDPDGETGVLTINGSNIGFGTTDPDSFAPSNVGTGREVVNRGTVGGTYIAARDDTSISAGNIIGAYLIRSNDTSGVKFGGMRGLADDSSGNFHLEFFAGNSSTDTSGATPAFQISDGDDIFFPIGDVNVGRTADAAYLSSEEHVTVWYSNSSNYVRIHGRAPGSGGDDVFSHVDNGTKKSEIEANGDFLSATNSYGSTSDERLKENIEASGSQWDDIKALQIKKYSMKDDDLDAPNMLGVIAQDLQASGMNGLVKTNIIKDHEDNPILDDDGNEQNFLSVKYSVLYMKAVKALQEAMTKIETLEAQNTTQATQIADLITRVEALEG